MEGIKSVAKISQELAYGEEMLSPEGETYISGGISGVSIPELNTTFNPVLDADNNIVISLITAQYLDASQYEIINWNPPIIEIQD
ncbi:hypothetical protein V1389_01955 [Flavobacterium rakeshii]|uniref:hypothetical protein n=1 Tax=Flavobacterium rakeshii TaxID=1038845 RepID=UPI002E7B839B|nr:hypothetical protein [Flavobacterium rakeshii]MEE1897080.1 hypothetical protein [Flavobacterium rakeshii]